MDSKDRHASTYLRDASVGEQAAVAVQAAAHRARDSVSRLVRVRDAQQFFFGSDRQDIRGWPVSSKDGEAVGHVASLFIDMRTRAIRYVGVSLDVLESRGAEVLVPVGWMSRPDDRQSSVVHALSKDQLLAAPRISKRPVTKADEDATLDVYGAAVPADAGSQDVYQAPMFDEWRLFGGPGSRAALG
jgi:hypothetical protein